MILKQIAYFFFIAFLVVFTTSNVLAQETKTKPFVYGQLGIEGGNYGGLTLSGTYVFPSKYVVQIGYQGLISNAEERPSNYQIGALDIFTFGVATAKDTYHIFHASFGKILELKNHPKTRFNILGGIGISYNEHATNFEGTGSTFGLVSNYSFDTESGSEVFLLLQPKVEFCLSQYHGISIGPVIKFSRRENLYGFSVNYIFGRLRNSIE